MFRILNTALLFLCLMSPAFGQKSRPVYQPSEIEDILKDASDFLEEEEKTETLPKQRFKIAFTTELFTDDNVQSLNSLAPTPAGLAARSDSGIGNELTLNYDFLPDRDRSLVAFFNATSFEHFRSSTRDQQSLKGGIKTLLPLGDQSGEETWNFQGEASYGSIWLDSINLRDSFDVRANVIFRQNAQNKTILSISSSSRDFTQPTSDPRQDRDGHIHNFGLSHNWNPKGWSTLAGQNAGLTFGVGRSLERTEGGFFNNDQNLYSLGLNFPIASRKREVIGSMTLTTAFADSTFGSSEQLQITGFERQDDSFSFNARTDFKLSDLYSIYLEYDYSDFDTNLPLTNFNRNRLFLGATLNWGN